MKLDKIAFARLIAHLQNLLDKRSVLTMSDIEEIDNYIDINIPEPSAIYPSVEDVNNLLMLMAEGTRKIEAIKLHRKLTGYGLKESKDLVEKYWVSKPIPQPEKQEYRADLNQGASLGDILAKAGK